MSEYPEHDKIERLGDCYGLLQEFAEFLAYHNYLDLYNNPQLVNTFLGIDEKKLEEERRRMLNAN